MKKILKTAGFEVLTASKYLTSPDYLIRGDILLYVGHHTATNLTTGSKATTSGSTTNTTSTPTNITSGNIAKGQKWFNTNYPNVLKSATGALLDVDNSCGSHSRWGALAVWKDLVNRKYGFSLTPSNKNFGASCKTAAKKAQIQKGASGTLVHIVEFILSAKGYYTGKMDADFGSGLETAVKAFQKARGITANGVVRSDTWYTLFN